MATDQKETTQKTTSQNTSASNEDIDEDEDLLYTYMPKKDATQMRWNTNLCRKPGK
jgi:hypothetical protein